MLEFLVTILLALIIFVPACMFTSSLFRLSDQARNSYGQLINEIQKVSDDDIITSSTMVIEIDPESFITIFSNKKAEKKELLIIKDSKNAPFTFNYPESQCTDKEGKNGACACLCREYEVDEKNNLNCNELLCQALENTVVENPWALWRDSDSLPRRYNLIVKEGDLGAITILSEVNSVWLPGG